MEKYKRWEKKMWMKHHIKIGENLKYPSLGDDIRKRRLNAQILKKLWKIKF